MPEPNLRAPRDQWITSKNHLVRQNPTDVWSACQVPCASRPTDLARAVTHLPFMSAVHPTIVVTPEDNLQFEVRVGDHVLVTDQPRSNGGDDAGPAPLDFLAVALGSCIAFYVRQFLASREISHEGLRVEVRYHKLSSPSRVGSFDVQIALPPDVPEEFWPLIERVVRACPAHNTLTHGATVQVETALIPQPS